MVEMQICYLRSLDTCIRAFVLFKEAAIRKGHYPRSIDPREGDPRSSDPRSIDPCEGDLRSSNPHEDDPRSVDGQR